jgi:hypothetical protein
MEIPVKPSLRLQYYYPLPGLFTLVATYDFAGAIRVNKPGGGGGGGKRSTYVLYALALKPWRIPFLFGSVRYLSCIRLAVDVCLMYVLLRFSVCPRYDAHHFLDPSLAPVWGSALSHLNVHNHQAHRV